MKTSQHPEENLLHAEAVEKIHDIAISARVALLGTTGGEPLLHFYPMAVQAVDDAGSLWFLSGRSSRKNHDIAANPVVQVLVSNPSDSQYLSLYGFATISDSRTLKEKYWSSLAKAWFPGGVDDPELTVINVQVERGHYWDTVHGKTISMLLIAAGALTGKAPDGGKEGNLVP